MSKSNREAKGYLSVRLKNSRLYRAISPARKGGSAQTAARPSQSPTNSSPNSVPVASGQAPQRPVTPNKSFTPDPAFKNAIEAYVAKLSDDDKADFQSPWDIMGKMKEIDEKNAKKSLSRTFGARIEKLLQLMSSFMNSVAICIQSNPEVSSLIVGGINCALSLVLGYIEFFESLTSMMEQIGGHLDYLSKFSSSTFRNLPDVQNALVRAYCDLLDFFVAVRGVFKNGNATYLKSFRLFLRITWEPFESKFKPIQDRFMDHALIVVRSAGVQDLIMRYEKGTQEDLKQKVEKRRKVLGWLSPIDYEEIHQKHFKKHFGDTGQWFLNHPNFGTWKDALGQKLLWCHGLPGTGKTVLASLVVEKLSAQYELSNNVGISFVYCNYKEPQEAAIYVRLFIKQLSRRMNELPVELEALYDKHYSNASTPGYTELQGVLVQISKHFEKVFLVLDALDECTDDQRRELFEVLHGIVSPGATNPGNINLFITSRKEQDIQRAFQRFPIIEIEARKVNEDIESYVTAQLDQYLQDGTLMITDTLKCKILTALVDRAGGMFLWVEYQLKHILSLTSYHDIEGALESLPEDMEQTYERIIRLIHEKPKPQRKLARRVLMWVAYAKRPLQLRELAYAVAMENETRGSDELKSMAPTAESLVGVCANLIVLDGHSDYPESYTARFVHFSVQEFLLKESPGLGSNFSVATLNIGPTIAHTEIARLCITFLLFCGSPTNFYFHLITYAHSAWVGHVRALTEIDKELMLLVLELFESGAFFKEKLGNGFEFTNGGVYKYIRLSHTKFSPSILALVLDLPLVSEYLEKRGCDQQNYPDDLYAMHYAARHNSYSAIERLCDQGFSVSLLDDGGCVPLYYATSKEVAQLILDKGADVNAQAGLCENLLQAAIRTGKKEITQLLLDRGADVNAQGGICGNALQAAASTGEKETVQLLLDRGADVNAQGGQYGNALQAAAYKGEKGIAQLLLDRGADVNAQGGIYGSALQAAVASGFGEEIVELLLDRGADANAQGGEHGSALQAAVCDFWSGKRIVKLLLDRGADVNAQGGVCGNALQAAAYRGEKGMVQLLLDRGADLNAQGGLYGNALRAAAAREGGEETIQLLLDRGADVNAQGGHMEMHYGLLP